LSAQRAKLFAGMMEQLCSLHHLALHEVHLLTHPAGGVVEHHV